MCNDAAKVGTLASTGQPFTNITANRPSVDRRRTYFVGDHWLDSSLAQPVDHMCVKEDVFLLNMFRQATVDFPQAIQKPSEVVLRAEREHFGTMRVSLTRLEDRTSEHEPCPRRNARTSWPNKVE